MEKEIFYVIDPLDGSTEYEIDKINFYKSTEKDLKKYLKYSSIDNTQYKKLTIYKLNYTEITDKVLQDELKWKKEWNKQQEEFKQQHLQEQILEKQKELNELLDQQKF